jgi:ABC-type glycerol-3-phosphate transport system substrate-binding protein
MFALYKNSSTSTSLPSITIWGTIPASTFNKYVTTINNSIDTPISVSYKYEDPTAFSQDFVAALARGSGPDAILISADMLLPHEDKLALIPYSALSQRTFMDTYVQEGQIYLSTSGIMALPFVIDPLVMYWDRDMFNAAGVASYPRYWDEFTAQSGLVSKMTVKDSNENIRKSAIAMGDFSTVDNSREILGTLLMQTGNPVTDYNKQGNLESTIKISAAVDPTPALKFFAQFVDPTNTAYSWNRSMQDSKTAFLSGTLATYFGFASELSDIQTKNPNLNFDVAPMPQLRTGGVKADYGRMYGLSIVRSTSNANGVYQILSILTQSSYLSTLSQTMYLPPVRTDLIAAGSNDPYISIFDQAALIAKTWVDADPVKSGQILGNVIESITSGQESIFQAINDVGNQYDALLRQATSQ